MDPSDPPGRGNTGDRCSPAGRGQIGLATNLNGGMLRLIASRHDDDDDDDDEQTGLSLNFICNCVAVFYGAVKESASRRVPDVCGAARIVR